MVNYGDKSKEEVRTGDVTTQTRKPKPTSSSSSSSSRSIKSAFAIPGRVSSSSSTTTSLPRTGGGRNLQRRLQSQSSGSGGTFLNGKENVSKGPSSASATLSNANGVKHRQRPQGIGLSSPLSPNASASSHPRQSSHRRRGLSKSSHSSENDDVLNLHPHHHPSDENNHNNEDSEDEEHQSKTRHKRKQTSILTTTSHTTTPSCTSTCTTHASTLHTFILNHVPCARKLSSLYNRLPRKAKIFVLCSWLLWKIVMTCLFLRVVFRAASVSSMEGMGDLTVPPASPVEVDSSFLLPPGRNGLLQQNSFAGKTLQTSRRVGKKQKRIPYAMLDTLPPPPQPQQQQQQQQQNQQAASSTTAPKPFRILHIVTSLVEYNTGGRGTLKGEDRLGTVLLPVLRQTILSMTSQPHWTIDVQLILGYTLTKERRQFVLDRLRDTGVGRVDFWEDAIPLSYNDPKKDVKMKPNTRGLARQHRFVIKDKFNQEEEEEEEGIITTEEESYDFFMAFEDDMYITHSQVRNFWDMSQELEYRRLDALHREEEAARAGLHMEQMESTVQHQLLTLNPRGGFVEGENRNMPSHGPLSSKQLKRLVPGFVRVEVLPKGTQEEFLGEEAKKDKLPPDFDLYDNATMTLSGEAYRNLLSPNSCCGLAPGGGKEKNSNDEAYLRQAQDGAHLVIWESHIVGITLRELPPLQDATASKIQYQSPLKHNWVAFLPGPKKLPPDEYIRAYWGGEDESKKQLFEFEENHGKKPGAEGRLFANQGGFMAGREQLLKINEYCGGRILPPFSDYSPRDFKDDGLVMHNVEFWSGGYQIYSGIGGGCNMQRVLSLDPARFEKQLMYHTANNKQKTIFPRARRFTRAVDYLGQLNAVRKDAEKDKMKRVRKGGEVLSVQNRRLR